MGRRPCHVGGRNEKGTDVKIIDALALMHEYDQADGASGDWETMCRSLAQVEDLCVLGVRIENNEMRLTGRDADGRSLLAEADIVVAVPTSARSLLLAALALLNANYAYMQWPDKDNKQAIVAHMEHELHGWCTTRRDP